MTSATSTILDLPSHYDPAKIVDLRFINYGALAADAEAWRRLNGLNSARNDRTKVGLLIIDQQNTFCNPNGDLYVGGRSGTGAVDDSRRIAEFIYRNLGVISEIYCTMDTHRAYAIFHQLFMEDENGNHPNPYTEISVADIESGKWTASPFMASALNLSVTAAQKHLLFYCKELARKGRYQLLIWPFHAMLGGTGHAIVSGVEEACFFHAAARGAQTRFEVKGTNAFTESYSVLGPEVRQLEDGKPLDQRNAGFIKMLLDNDMVIAVGEAKSHCFAWSIDDLLSDILIKDPELAKKVYLMEDCTSPVVTPFQDFTDDADAAFAKFAAAGMHVVKSTDPIETWDGVRF